MAASFNRRYLSLVLITACLVSGPVAMGLGYFYRGLWGAVLCGIPFAVLLLFYGWVQVLVEGHYIGVFYGIGVHRLIVPLTQVQEQKVVPNAKLCWIYVPRASHVLELVLRGRSSFTIPVDEPTVLMRVINETLRG